jgi:hypothetical protein
MQFKSAVLKFRVINGFGKFSDSEESRLARYYKGLGNQIAENIRNGQTASEEAKRHLKFVEYMMMCRNALIENLHSKYSSELHVCLTLGWNLCARIDTVTSLHSYHLDWDGDSLMIGIAKSKRNYQECSVFYHVFSNYLT